jgi:branched-subunit amino acid aminotransferase/4-amino-4-deoxychorismate lyase
MLNSAQTQILPILRELLPHGVVHDEYRITIITSPSPFEMLAIAEKLPESPVSVQVEVQILSRNAPQIKSTSWVANRQSAESRKHCESNEVLLMGEDGLITEGLSSNFAVVTIDGVILTAPKTMVLSGTMMRLVRAASIELNIPIREECPSIHKLGEYATPFITSTSRGLLPIHTILLSNGTILKFETDHPVIKILQDQIHKLLITRSTSLH